MASSVDGGTAPRQLANRINLDAQLDEQRQREYEALVRWCTSNRLTWSVLYTMGDYHRRKSLRGYWNTSTHRKWKSLTNV